MSVTFLDVTVHLTDGVLWTDLYCKPTDSHNYLNFDSAHPRHSFKAIPYSQFLRLRRICTNDSDFYRHCNMLAKHFLRRGYPMTMLTGAWHRARHFDRQRMLDNYVPKYNKRDRIFDSTNQKLAVVTTYHPTFNNMRVGIEEDWPILATPATRLVRDTPLLFSYRKPKSLSNHLVGALLPALDHAPKEHEACKRPRTCKYCRLLDKSGSITGLHDGRTHRTRTNFNCRNTHNFTVENGPTLWRHQT